MNDMEELERQYIRRDNDKKLFNFINNFKSDFTRLEKKIDKLDESINGNGSKGLKEQVGELRGNIKFIYGAGIFSIVVGSGSGIWLVLSNILGK